jgi:hypothetical protein
MIIFKKIELKKFRNIKHIKLEDLRDLNILIGPNNCGKTNFLEFISKMGELNYGTFYDYLCKKCQEIKKKISEEINVILSLTAEDFYLKNTDKGMEISLLLNEEEINKLVPRALEKQREKLEKIKQSSEACESIGDEIVMKNEKGSSTLYGEHLSPFIHEGVIGVIKNSILCCPEERLQSYKGKEFSDYIKEQKLSRDKKMRWVDFLRKTVDPRIDDERYERLIRKVDSARALSSSSLLSKGKLYRKVYNPKFRLR